ncbi:MAG: ribokinase [Sedimentisphaerales bacterium]|nr:ribokinase [Sedimentisphaerales bacterium]
MKATTPNVVVIGGTYVDMAIKCRHTPLPGQTVAGFALSYIATGPGPNQAVEAALCGCDVHLISKVGSDPFAQMAKACLTDFGVNTDFIFVAETKYTGVVVTLVDERGENAVCTYPGANSALQQQDIEVAEPIISQADVCLIHGQLPEKAIVTAIRCAELHGTKIILNPAKPIERNPPTVERSSNLPIEYFSADILIPNLDEAAEITESGTAGTANIHTAKLIGSDLVARGVGSAVITMGRRGCMVVDRSGADHIPAFEVDLVDQTGRGDAFAGALAAYCAVKAESPQWRDYVREAAKFASAAGALACTKFGSLEAMPTKNEIIELLQKQDSE